MKIYKTAGEDEPGGMNVFARLQRWHCPNCGEIAAGYPNNCNITRVVMILLMTVKLTAACRVPCVTGIGDKYHAKAKRIITAVCVKCRPPFYIILKLIFEVKK